MCCTVIEGKCKRCISDPWTVHSVAKGAYVKEIPRDLISHFNYCRQWRGSLAGALKLLLVFAIILCEFELCCYCFICSCSDHHTNSNSICTAPSRRDPHGRGVASIMIVRRTEGCAREGDPSFCPLPRVASTRSCVQNLEERHFPFASSCVTQILGRTTLLPATSWNLQFLATS